MEKCAMEKAMDIIRETMTTMDNTTPEYEECYCKLEDIIDERAEMTTYINNWLSYHRPASYDTDYRYRPRYNGPYNRH